MSYLTIHHLKSARSTIRSVCLAVVFLLNCTTSVSAAVPERLVRQLGSRDFQSRIDAEKELLRLGAQSYSAVLEGSDSSDDEIRLRSLRLLKRVQQLAFRESLNQIRTNPWLVPEELTPGWPEFQKILGDGSEARELYVQILGSEIDLMLSLRSHNWPIDFERRCAELRAFSQYRNSFQLHPGQVAALLFLASHPENRPSGDATNLMFDLIRDRDFAAALSGSQSSEILRDLVANWIKISDKASPIERLSHAAALELDAAVPLARQIIQQRKQLQGSATHLENAIFYLARYGGPQCIEDLEVLLDDRQSLRGRTRDAAVDLQVRDVALVALLTVTNQDPEEYGFHDLITKRNYLYIGSSARFESEAARQRALETWEQWASLNLKSPVPDQLAATFGVLL